MGKLGEIWKILDVESRARCPKRVVFVLLFCFFMNVSACPFVRKLSLIPSSVGNWRTDDVQMMWGPESCPVSWMV